MKKIYGIALLFICLAGCKSKIPGDVIPPDQMAAILYDIHVTDGFISSVSRPDSAKIVAASYYKGVYKKFGIDSAAYTASMNYYYAHPELLGSIYTQVTASLKKSKDSVDKVNDKKAKLLALKIEKARKKTKDSLAKINALLQKPADRKKAAADSLKKVKAAKRLKDSLDKVLSVRKKVISTKNATDRRKFKRVQPIEEVNK